MLNPSAQTPRNREKDTRMSKPEKKALPANAKVKGKSFEWTTDDGDTVTIPLKIRMKLIRSMSDKELDADGMFEFLEALIPDQAAALDEMDVNDFQRMFTAWQSHYNSLQDADLGESSSSST